MVEYQVTVDSVRYTVVVDNGLSWRDCPFFRVRRNSDGVVVASGMGGKDDAFRALLKVS